MNSNKSTIQQEHLQTGSQETSESENPMVEGSATAMAFGQSLQTNFHSTMISFEQQVVQQNQQFQLSMNNMIKGIAELSKGHPNLKGTGLKHKNILAHSSLEMLELAAILNNSPKH